MLRVCTNTGLRIYRIPGITRAIKCDTSPLLGRFFPGRVFSGTRGHTQRNWRRRAGLSSRSFRVGTFISLPRLLHPPRCVVVEIVVKITSQCAVSCVCDTVYYIQTHVSFDVSHIHAVHNTDKNRTSHSLQAVPYRSEPNWTDPAGARARRWRSRGGVAGYTKPDRSHVLRY